MSRDSLPQQTVKQFSRIYLSVWRTVNTCNMRYGMLRLLSRFTMCRWHALFSMSNVVYLPINKRYLNERWLT